MSDEPQHPLTHPCPACGQSVAIPVELTGAPLQCPACGEQFIIDDEPPDPEIDLPVSAEDRLDLPRMKQIAQLRRATERSRSHALIAAVVCIVGVIQLAIVIARNVGWNWRTAIYGAVLLLAGTGAIFFLRKAIALRREQLNQPPGASHTRE